MQQARDKGWNSAQYLSALCEQELADRDSRRIGRYAKESRLPTGKTLATFDFSQVPTLNAGQVQALAATTDWTRQARNVLLFGASGVGKTHLAAAIGHGLVEQSVRVRYVTTAALVQELQLARSQLRLEDALQKLDKYRVIVLDDFGYVKKSEQETHVLFELIAHRYETGSLIVTSNQPFAEWDRIFPDPMMTVAAVDRLIHHATHSRSPATVTDARRPCNNSTSSKRQLPDHPRQLRPRLRQHQRGLQHRTRDAPRRRKQR